MMILTKVQVKQAMELLADVAENWNDCAEDGDRGRGNDALGLLVFEDGSGMLGSVFDSVENWNNQFTFETLDELAQYIIQWCNLGSIKE